MTVLTLLGLGVATMTQDGVDLTKLYTVGRKATYEFKSQIRAEMRIADLETFLPDNMDFVYQFTIDTERLKPDGAADVRFRREKVTIEPGEDENGPVKPIQEKTGENYLITFSRSNQILGMKDESPKKPEKKDGGGLFARIGGTRTSTTGQLGLPWIQQLHQLAGFVNFFDFHPVLPIRPSKIGDTWKETIGYTPAVIQKGADKGKPLMGRIDYTYTFKGDNERDGKKYLWIQGVIKIDTDASPLLGDLIGSRDGNPFKEIRYKMDGTVDYYLDPATRELILVRAQSTGGCVVWVKGEEARAYYEERFKSTASLNKK